MRKIELLAPARNADIGIAAIDCGADAVYIAGPQFGARKDAGNLVSEIERLCSYASLYGVRVFVTFNILLRSDELPEVHAQMLECQRAGASAFIIRDPRLCLFDDITIPLHASTQCSIRSVARAQEFEQARCGRVVLERQLSLPQIREISSSVNCEVECFVHGALCVGYSGGCILSEYLSGRSADRGECVQACRNLYDLVDDGGKVWAKNKALLSLKDLNLCDDLLCLLDAGVSSLKIEGRLKNISYVRNVVRAYSLALDKIISSYPDRYARASFGKVEGGFAPSLDKTFNRGYTRLCLENHNDDWANFDAPKSMGEKVARVKRVIPSSGGKVEIVLDKAVPDLSNGDGFAFVSGSKIIGFRADICDKGKIVCRLPEGLIPGVELYRNLNRTFEKYMQECPCHRYIGVQVRYDATIPFDEVIFSAQSEDGRSAEVRLKAFCEATNPQRARAMYRTQIEKHTGEFSFSLARIEENLPLAFLSAAELNSVRRSLAQGLSSQPCGKIEMCNPQEKKEISYDIGRRDGELLRSKYCIRAQIGQCLKKGGRRSNLYLFNNGRRLPLLFDCRNCEMAVLEEDSHR